MRGLTPWFDDDCRTVKRSACRLKRRYYKSKSDADRSIWIAELKKCTRVYQSKSRLYWGAKIAENSKNSKKLWNSLRAVLGRSHGSLLASSGRSANDFLQFFKDKTADIAKSTEMAPRPVIEHTAQFSFTSFHEVSSDDIVRLIIASPNKQSALDPVPMRIVKASCQILAPSIAYICNRSLAEGYLPPSQKEALVFPSLKKPGMDKLDLKSYRPISNLTFLSKLIERVVCIQLTAYLEENKLLPSCQ